MLGENPYLGGNCLSGCLQVSKFHFSFSPPPLPIPWWSFQHYSVGADFGILFMLLLKPLESCWKHPRLSCSAASTRIGYSWSDHGIYITGKCKSIYTKKKKKGRNRPGAFKNKHYFHPIIQKCIWGGRHFIWAHGLLRLGTIIYFFPSYANVCRFLKHACMYYTLWIQVIEMLVCINRIKSIHLVRSNLCGVCLPWFFDLWVVIAHSKRRKINMQNTGRLLMGLLPILAQCFSTEADLEIAF